MAVQLSDGGDGPSARPRVSSGAVFFDTEGRVLLVNPTDKDYWNLPGGGVDAGETPRAACVREVREELGLAPAIGPLRLAAWTSANGDCKLFFVFDGGVLNPAQQAAISLDRRELHECAFVTEAESRTMLPGWQSRLFAEVFQARTDGRMRYVELDTSGTVTFHREGDRQAQCGSVGVPVRPVVSAGGWSERRSVGETVGMISAEDYVFYVDEALD